MKALALWLSLLVSTVCGAQQATSFAVSFPGLRNNAPQRYLLAGVFMQRKSIGGKFYIFGSAFEHARRFTWLETGRVHLQSYADAL